jgi:capsular polysaccharide biosynthesis protein
MNAVNDLGAEREIDLGRWKQAAIERWWLVAAGVVAGIVVGALYSLSGGSVYQASVLLAPGQPFSPTGAPVLNYQSSPRAIEKLVTGESALKRAAKAAGIGVGALRGHVSTQTVATGASTSTASRGAVLLEITVQLAKPKHAEDAANALGNIVKTDTTSPYVQQSITAYATKIKDFQAHLTTLQKRIDVDNAALNSPGLTDVEKLIAASQLDNAQTRFGTISDNLSLAQQQQTLAKTVELAQIIEPAVAHKTTARSRRNSILVGLLIGLIAGVIAAIFVDTRARRPRPT